MKKHLPFIAYVALLGLISAGFFYFTHDTQAAQSYFNASQLSTTTTPGFVFQSNGPNAPGSFVATSTLGITGSGTVGAGTAGQFPFYKANGTALTATSSIFILPNGNIGIGTTTPWANLSIQDQPGAPQSQPIFSVGSSTIGVNAFTVFPDGYIQAGPLASKDTAFCTFGKYCLGYFGSDNTLSGVNVEAGNYSPGGSAYGGFTVLNNLDDATGAHYAFFGLTSSNYNDPTFGTSQAFPNQMQLVNSDGQIVIQANFNGTTTVPTANNIIFTINGTSVANEVARITPAGLGIGTTTPGSLLSLGNTTGINFTAATSTFNSAGGINLISGCFAVRGTCLTSGSGSSFAYPFPYSSNTGTTSPLLLIASTTIGNGGANGLTINGNATTTGIGYFAGNVGIGTSSPSNVLVVAGTGTNALSYNNNLGICNNSGITSSGCLSFAPGAASGQGDVLFTGENSAGTLLLNVGGTAKKTFQVYGSGSNGLQTIFTSLGQFGTGDSFVGINATTTPFALLSIAGSLGGTTPLFALSTSTSLGATSTVAEIDANGNFLADMNGNTVQLGATVATSSAQALTLSSNVSGSGISLYNTADQSTNYQRFGINISGNTLTMGTTYAGTFTTGPYLTVAIKGGFNSQTTISLLTGNTNTFSDGGNGSGGQSDWQFSGNLFASSGAIQNSFSIVPSLNQTGTASYSALQIKTTETTLGSNQSYLIEAGTSTAPDLFDVTNTGSVGIGSSTPAAELGVQARAGFSYPNNSLFNVGSSTASATTSLFTVLNSGNVGIGTTTPGSLLSIQGIANFTTATSSIQSTGGINLTNGGCYAINGVCISGGGATITLSGAVTGSGTSAITTTFGSAAANTILMNISGAGAAPAFTATSSIFTGALGQSAYFGGSGQLMGTSTVFISTQSYVGIGTTTPEAAFTVAAASSTVASGPYAGLVDIISGLENTTLKLFEEIDQYGSLIVSGDAPTINVSSCGVGSTVAAASSQRAGAINLGTGSVTSCFVTFAHPYPSGTTVHVFVNEDNGTQVASDATNINTAGFAITAQTSIASRIVSYIVIATQ